MIRILMTVGVVLLLTDSALAQSYWTQVRLAVATYGYEAAKQHALAHYGKEAVEAGEKCLKGRDPLSGPHRADGQNRPRRG
jgi:hypothetical protein